MKAGKVQKVDTRYARSGETRIAYQVVGQGSLDLVLVLGFPSNLEILWEDPGYGRLMKRLSTFCRLILFDKRGTGLSDSVDPRSLPDLQTRIDDIRAVMDSTGCGRAALLGVSDGAAVSMLFAATYPKKVRSLILHGGYASFHDSVMDTKRLRADIEAAEISWGTGSAVSSLAPSRADDRTFTEWWGRLERLSASPTAAVAMARMIGAIDVRDALPTIDAPTLLLHRAKDGYVGVDSSRQLARAIKEARLVELPGRDHQIWTGDVDGVADLVEEFLTGERPVAGSDRVLAAVLVARILGTSTGLSAAVAGRQLHERMALFREAIPKVLARYEGHGRWSGSERIDARFSSAARAAGCAIALRDTAASLGLAIAQGIHAGEVDVSLEALSGNPVDVAGRIAASTRGQDILLSRLASDLVSGAGLQFVDRGTIALDGVLGSLRRCCRTPAAKDSHRESERLDVADEQALSRPLPHDELVQLQSGAQEARVTAYLAGQGDGVARTA